MAERHDAKLIGSIVAAVVLALGGGASGYYARGPTEQHAAAAAAERVERIEQWRAARDALDARDREERQQLVVAMQDLAKTNSSLRDAVLIVTERQGTMESRLHALEMSLTTTIPASKR